MSINETSRKKRPVTCSRYRMPPRKNPIPRIRSKFARIEPRREAWTIRILSWDGQLHIVKWEADIPWSRQYCLLSVRTPIHIKDDSDLHEDNQLHRISERHIDQRTQRIAHLTRNTFGCMSQKSRQRDDGYAIQPKHDTAMNAIYLRCCYAGRYEYKQEVDWAVSQGVVGRCACGLEECSLWRGCLGFWRGWGSGLLSGRRTCALS